jgi:predicted exporter
MKPRFLSSPRVFPGLWLFFHLAIAAALAVSLLFSPPPRIKTDLFDLLPGGSGLKSASAADRILTARTGRGVFILTGSRDFGEARDAARLLYQDLADSPAFENISLYVDDTVTAQLSRYLHQYRYVLLDRDTRALLEGGEAQSLAGQALAAAFGAFTFTSLDTIETDPFLLADRGMRRFLGSALLSSGALSPRDEVLAARLEDVWYVLIRGRLSPAAVSLTGTESGAALIYQAAGRIQAQNPGLRFVYSGVPFHSYASSSGAQREISQITTVTSLIILVLFLLVFRSPLPVLITLAAIGVSALAAVGAALLFFREIHVLTFVFGTTLIGMGVDYSVHYTIHRRGNPALESGAAVRARISRSVTMSLVSSCICFALLLFAPFSILRQFAVFSIIGLVSSFLSVFCLFPLLKNPPREGRFVFFRKGPATRSAPRSAPQAAPRPGTEPGKAGPGLLLKAGALILVAGGALVLLLVNRDRLRVENNLSGLYTMPDYLLESEKTAAQVLNHGSAGWYFIVSGESREEVLENEEALTAALDREIAAGNLSAYLGTTLFIPSPKTQRQSYAAAEALLPWAEGQFEYLGFPPEAVRVFREDFAQARDRLVFPDGDIPPYLADIIANLWIGETGGRWYSCVLPLHGKSEAPFRALAADLGGVFFVHKVKDISGELDALTRVMILLFGAAYGVVALVVFRFYPLREALRICAVPLLVVLVTLGVLAAADIALSLFSMTGLVLVFGLGLDYMFYMAEDPAAPGYALTVLAVLLSYATTALSFGALSLSGFAPVHIFGLTVFTGLSAAFMFAMLFRGGLSRENQRTSGAGEGSAPSRSRHTPRA